MRTIRLLLLLLGLVVMVGCNTFHGAGEDFEQGWQATKDAFHEATH